MDIVILTLLGDIARTSWPPLRDFSTGASWAFRASYTWHRIAMQEKRSKSRPKHSMERKRRSRRWLEYPTREKLQWKLLELHGLEAMRIRQSVTQKSTFYYSIGYCRSRLTNANQKKRETHENLCGGSAKANHGSIKNSANVQHRTMRSEANQQKS